MVTGMEGFERSLDHHVRWFTICPNNRDGTYCVHQPHANTVGYCNVECIEPNKTEVSRRGVEVIDTYADNILFYSQNSSVTLG